MGIMLGGSVLNRALVVGHCCTHCDYHGLIHVYLLKCLCNKKAAKTTGSSKMAGSEEDVQIEAVYLMVRTLS